jgi:riboflavin synthase alpha subunit
MYRAVDLLSRPPVQHNTVLEIQVIPHRLLDVIWGLNTHNDSVNVESLTMLTQLTRNDSQSTKSPNDFKYLGEFKTKI